jgi:DNA-binding CsgD family transcriptional regulator/tetratricopeptide (TPR) repeat protein
MAARVSSGRLIGRERELEDLAAALARASSGEPSVAFLAGESGVGKTRLLAEARERAAAQGARVLSGDCVALGDGELPYAPIVAALRPLVRARDPVLAELAPASRAELGRLLPGLDDADAGPRAPDAPDAAAQGRLFEALLALLERLGRSAPVLLALEDVHWADRSTRAFLSFLVRSLETERLLGVVTYRPDELHRRHPLRTLLAELERDPRTWRLDLEPLDRGELAELLECIRGDVPTAALADRLFARSEGNPLFAEELLAAGSDGRGPLPESLRDALMLRVDDLPPAAQHVLRLLAVGQRVDHGTLAEASGLDPAVLADALRAAAGAHIVVADDEGRLAFRHALLAEVVEEDLLPGERIELHRTLARTLEHRLEEGSALTRPAAIAHHWHAAGDAEAAFAASLRAAAAAEHVHAYGEAADLLERALELWERLPDPSAVSGCDHATLLSRAADAQRWGGHQPRAEALLVAALDEVDRETEPHRRVDMLTRLAQIRWQLNRIPEAEETAKRGMALLGDDDESKERARLLAWWANSRMLSGRFREAAAAARRALAVAERAGSGAAELRALNALGISLAATGHPEEGLAMLRRGLAAARQRGHPMEISSAYVNLADALNLDGQTAEALAVAQEGAEEVHVAGRLFTWNLAAVAEIAFDAGRWDLAAERLPATERRYDGTTLLNVELRRAELALGRGDEETAERSLQAVARIADDATEPQFLGPLGVLMAELHLRRGDVDAARATIDEALDRLEFCTEDVLRLARVAWLGVVVEATRAMHARDRRDEATEAEAITGAAMHLLRVRAAAHGGRRVGLALLAAAKADAARARGRNQPARWAAAAEAWRGVGRPYPEAIARWRQAEAHAARDERTEAEAAAVAALRAARELGSRWLAAEVGWLAARARLRLDRDAEEDDAPAAAAPLPFDLTPREAQVLALLARGATNREVGEALFMAEKTASVHVSRILRKLGVRGRTEAAAVAYRHGLASGPVPDVAGRAG